MLLSKGIKSVEEFNFDLDLDFYLAYYPDLADAGISSLQQAKIHWLSNGKSENRFRTIRQWVEQHSGLLYFDINSINLNKVIEVNKDYAISATNVLNVAVGVITQPISFYNDVIKDAKFYEQLGINCYLEYRSGRANTGLDSARLAWQMSLYFNQTCEVLEQLGKTYLDQSDYRTAQKIYQSALLFEDSKQSNT